MNAESTIRSQLHSLRIDRDKRPTPGTLKPSGGGSRFIKYLIILLVLAGLGTLGYSQRDRLKSIAQPAPAAANIQLLTVRAETTEPGPSTVYTAVGRIVSDHRVEVATKVSGQVIELHFEQGDRVAKGQLLARIEDVIYRARRDEAHGRVTKSKANLEYQKINFDRVKRMYERTKVAAGIEFADAQRALHEAEAQLKSDQATLDFFEKQLIDCDVVAPIAGVILERNVEVGDFVAAEAGRGAMANAEFGSIADMNALRVEVDVSELDIARLHQDMRCRVTPDAYKDRSYPGFVMWIDPGANYSKATVQVFPAQWDPKLGIHVT